MKIKQRLIAAALGVVLSGSVAAGSMSAAQAETLLQSKGFTNVSALEFENGLWLGTATDSTGVLVDIRLDPAADKVTTTKTTTTTSTTSQPTPASNTIVKSNTVIKEVPVVVEKPVIVERIVEQPVVRQPIIVHEQILVPLGDRIDEADVRAVLAGAGYHDIHDIEWLNKRGVWKAEARDATGDDREIHVDPFDARIVHVEDD